jgi:cold shock CspA family protein
MPLHISNMQKAGYSELVEGARISYEMTAGRRQDDG